jgi:hypothetical protein
VDARPGAVDSTAPGLNFGVASLVLFQSEVFPLDQKVRV